MTMLIYLSQKMSAYYFDVFIDIYHEFLLVYYCCVLLEIKLTSTTTK